MWCTWECAKGRIFTTGVHTRRLQRRNRHERQDVSSSGHRPDRTGQLGTRVALGLEKNHPRIEVVAVADEDAEERQAKQEELAAPRAYADWREMLEAEQPEVVTVGPRWTDCHLEMVLACLEVGAHVYCEKPHDVELG